MFVKKHKTFWLASLVLVILVSALYLTPRPDLYQDYLSSQAVYDSNGKLLRITLANDDKYRLRVPFNRISPVLIRATLLYEDRYFYRHHGINPIALFKAGWATYVSGTHRRGASTITMQLARMRFNIKSRTLTGKLQQILRALQIEWHYSKEEILAAYFNYAPYGGNIESIASASLIYFNKTPDKLSLHEILTLAVIPQSPSYRSLDKGADNPGLLTARNELIRRWVSEYPKSKPKQAMLMLPVQARNRKNMPFLAPHFVESILATNHSAHIRTRLDSNLQTLIERNTRNYLETVQQLGINNASALLVDYRDMSVKALLGSADYHSNAIHGQVNGTRAKRSPGSTLKPFIYALGIDQGLIHPKSMLKDTQTSYGVYNPENFDHEFHGPIDVTNALIRSRNVPAVFVASKISKPDLYEFLKTAHVDLPRSKQHYGLSLVLGGAEIRMQSLVRLYAMLANQGKLRPLQWLYNTSEYQTKNLLSPQSAYLTYKMLTQNKRPHQSYDNHWLRKSTPVAWKTGTSYGYRDAWSVGIFGPYVLAVWVGNFDGKANPALIGRKMAAPLFFRLVDAIRTRQPELVQHTIPIPQAIKKIKICSLSGKIPTKACPVTFGSDFIPGVSPIKACNIHRYITVDKNSGLRACTDNENTIRKVYEFWPSDLLQVFKAAGISRRSPPPFMSNCTSNQSVLVKNNYTGIKPHIRSPTTHVKYLLRSNTSKNQINATQTLPLTATTDADVKHVYWFLDEEYLGKIRADKDMYWTMRPGNFNLRVIDDHGRSNVIHLSIRQSQ